MDLQKIKTSFHNMYGVSWRIPKIIIRNRRHNALSTKTITTISRNIPTIWSWLYPPPLAPLVLIISPGATLQYVHGFTHSHMHVHGHTYVHIKFKICILQIQMFLCFCVHAHTQTHVCSMSAHVYNIRNGLAH